MMLPPSEDQVTEPYDRPRGTCPSCGDQHVRHLVIGYMAGPPATGGTPDWVSWVGCVHPGYDRTCDACGHTWTASSRGEAAE